MRDDEAGRAALARREAQAARGIEARGLKDSQREGERSRLHALFQSHQGFRFARGFDDQHARRIKPELHQSAP